MAPATDRADPSRPTRVEHGRRSVNGTPFYERSSDSRLRTRAQTGGRALLLAHGQPSAPAGPEAAMAALARAVARLLPGWQVRGATLAAPGALEAALAAFGPAPVAVYPHFMTDGWFVGTRIPDRLAAAGRHDCPVLAPFGRDPATVGALPARRPGRRPRARPRPGIHDPAPRRPRLALRPAPRRGDARRRRGPRRGRRLPGRRHRLRRRGALDRRGRPHAPAPRSACRSSPPATTTSSRTSRRNSPTAASPDRSSTRSASIPTPRS